MLDGGSLQIRTGASPTETTDVDSGMLLATLFFPTPAFSIAAPGLADIVPNAYAVAVAAGTAAHYRAKDSTRVVVMQGSVGESATTSSSTTKRLPSTT